jgi:beta-lactamase regulating signal transducer with metallopeptidase domain
MNAFADGWALFMLDRTLGSTLVFLLAALIWFAMRKRISSRWSYLLFGLVLLKLITPFQPFGLISLDKDNEKSPAISNVCIPIPVNSLQSISDISLSTNISHKLNEDSRIPVEQASVSLWRRLQELVSGLSIQAFLMIGWFSVVLCLLLKLIYIEWRIKSLIRQSEPLDLDFLPFDFPQFCRDAGVKYPVRLYFADWAPSPFVAGIIRPIIVAPSHFHVSYRTEEIKWVLLHELSHIRRWDALVKLIQKLVQIVFFFHPVVWINNRILDRFREFACDDAAMHGSESSRYECGAGFLRIVQLANNPSSLLSGTVTLFHSKKLIKERLMRILNYKSIIDKPYSILMASLFGLLVLCTMPMGIITSHAQDTDVEVDVFAQPAPMPKVKVKSEKIDFDFDYEYGFEKPDITMGDFDNGQPPHRGVWAAQFREGKFKFRYEFYTKKGRSNFGDQYKDYQKIFTGLDSVDENSSVDNITFTNDGDAGTIIYKGSFEEGLGTGYFAFEPKKDFVEKLEKRGIEGEIKNFHLFLFTNHGFRLSTLDKLADLGYEITTFKQLEKICLFDVNPEYIAGLKELGFSDLSFDRLVEMSIHNVSLDFIRDFQKAGYKDLSAKDFVKLRIHNVSIAFIESMNEMGYKNLSSKELIDLRIHNISASDIKSLSEMGYANLPLKTYMKMGIHGVKPDYIKEIARLGYKDIPADQLVNMRIHNVKPAFIEALVKEGYKDLSAKQLVDLRIHNYKPGLAKKFVDMGYERPSIDLMKQFCLHNVSFDYISDFEKLGYKDIPMKQFIQMKIHNVRTSFVKEIIDLGYKDVSAKDLIIMRNFNISPEFIKQENEKAGEKLSINQLVKQRINRRVKAKTIGLKDIQSDVERTAKPLFRELISNCAMPTDDPNTFTLFHPMQSKGLRIAIFNPNSDIEPKYLKLEQECFYDEEKGEITIHNDVTLSSADNIMVSGLENLNTFLFHKPLKKEDVKLTSKGSELEEDFDYEVDYEKGIIIVYDSSILEDDFSISVEKGISFSYSTATFSTGLSDPR